MDLEQGAEEREPQPSGGQEDKYTLYEDDISLGDNETNSSRHPRFKSSSLSEPLFSSTSQPSVPPSSAHGRAVSYDGRYPQHHDFIPTTTNSPDQTWQNFLPLPLLRRSLSNPTPPTSVEIFYCDICLENHIISDLFQLQNCSCKFCKSSLGSYYESLIRDGIIQFYCPTCHIEVPSHQIQHLISNEMYLKYLRFLEMKSNPGYRECPRCGSSTIGSIANVQITCSNCHEIYCFLHNNAHPGLTCQQYMRSQRKIEYQNLSTIRRTSRKCPSCGCDTEKNGGCNHMTCSSCGENWCWLCGRNITGVINHYDTITGCPGGQFADASDWAFWTIFPCLRTICWQYFTRIPYFLFLLVFLPCLLVIAVSSFVLSIPLLILLFPCAFCHKCRLSEKSCCTLLYDTFLYILAILTTFFIFSTLYLFELLWLPFALLFSIVLYPSYLISRSRDVNTANQSFCDLTRRYFTFIDQNRTGYTNTYWCFPLSSFEYFSGSSLKDFFMVVYLKVEEQSWSTGI